MRKYAEIYGGRVRDIRTSHLEYADFCSIFAPNTFWVEITGMNDIQVGWLMKVSETQGTYFEVPETTPDMDSFEYQKQTKLDLLEAEWQKATNRAYVMSSIGHEIDATQRAKSDIEGLLDLLAVEPSETVGFRCRDNVTRPVTEEQLKSMNLEVIKNGHYLYKQKWAFYDAVNAATSKEEIDAVQIEFVMMNFTPKAAPVTEP